MVSQNHLKQNIVILSEYYKFNEYNEQIWDLEVFSVTLKMTFSCLKIKNHLFVLNYLILVYNVI